MKERGEKNCHKCCKGNHSPLPTSRPMPGQCPSNSHLGSQTLSPLPSPPPTFLLPLLQFLLLSIPLVSSGQLSWLCRLPASCPPPACLLGKRGRKPLHCLVVAGMLVCYQHCFGHKCEAYHHADCYKKINSIAARPSTAGENAAGRARGNVAYSREPLDQLSCV